MPAQIILDIDDVLISDPLPRLWQLLAAEVGLSVAAVEELWAAELREAFLTGQADQDALWAWLAERFSLSDPTPWFDYLDAHRYPLLSLQMIRPFSAQATVTLFSNGRHDWLDPIIDGEGIRPFCRAVILSTDTGLLKPNPEAFVPLTALRGPCLYVDDDPVARDQAQSLGYQVLAADRLLTWVDQAIVWLRKNNRRRR